MLQLLLIGLIVGIVTGVSPCILPVLPVVLAVSVNRRPTLVVAGLTISFAAITLLGTLALNALGLPHAVLRWAGITLLTVVGLGMIFPRLGEAIEEPFSRLPRPTFLQQRARGKGGFLVGLALGAVYVPCAGPILAAITVAGSTGEIGLSTVALTLAFAVGVALPLLIFAFAGNQIGERVDAVRRHRRLVGVVVVLLAVAIAFDAPARLQRAVPDWTGGIQRQLGESEQVQNALETSNGSLEACRTAAPDELHDCGPAPELDGLTGWFNTNEPITTHTAPATLVDFWAYACINCQRAGKHITALYDAYEPYGLEVIGVHAPEYGFEHDASNVQAAAKKDGINYPVAQDNDFRTWKNFHNRYWPARYLIDSHGTVRHIHEGEGNYAETEQLIRDLLLEANPDAELPDPIEKEVGTQTSDRNPETYLGYQRAQYVDNRGFGPGVHTFPADATPKPGHVVLRGEWDIAKDHVIPQPGAELAVNVHAAHVQAVVSGSGTLAATLPDGTSKTLAVSDGTVDVAKENEPIDGVITLRPDPGVTLYSLTFG